MWQSKSKLLYSCWVEIELFENESQSEFPEMLANKLVVEEQLYGTHFHRTDVPLILCPIRLDSDVKTFMTTFVLFLYSIALSKGYQIQGSGNS